MFRKLLSLTVVVSFLLTSLGPLPQAHADTSLGLPQPGVMVNLSPAYDPVIIKGLTVHKENPFLFDFIVDVGQDKVSGNALKIEGEKLIKYFLAGLAIPDRDLWVNLSPYEKNKMIPEILGKTDMGRDLLEQDYILKQITASLIYPEKKLGRSFWDKVYAEAQQKYGTTQVPVNTFNKVWILADKAEVFEHDQTAFVVGCHLKVMLEEDYLALQKHSSKNMSFPNASVGNPNTTHSIASKIVKEIVLPELEKEVNTGKNFANLRQIFNSIILASWYKINLKEALLTQVYADRSKVKGIDLNDPSIKEQIYEQYLKAYKRGVFNYIKEDVNASGAMIPRKYFSGGEEPGEAARPKRITNAAQGTALMTQDRDGGHWHGFAKLETAFTNGAMKTVADLVKEHWFLNTPEEKIESLLTGREGGVDLIPNVRSHQIIRGAEAINTYLKGISPQDAVYDGDAEGKEITDLKEFQVEGPNPVLHVVIHFSGKRDMGLYRDAAMSNVEKFQIPAGAIAKLGEYFGGALENPGSTDYGLSYLPSRLYLSKDLKPGNYIGLDWSGTNLKMTLMNITEGQPPRKIAETVPRAFPEELKGPSDESRQGLLKFITGAINELPLQEDATYHLGLVFAHEVEHKSANSGIVRKLSKGWKSQWIIGQDVGKVLQEAIDQDPRLNTKKITVDAVLNDVAGTLKAVPGAVLSAIFGTGFNMGVIDKNGQIINLEAGEFFHVPSELITDIDEDIFKNSEPAGRHRFEKMISGQYLIEIFQKCLQQLAVSESSVNFEAINKASWKGIDSSLLGELVAAKNKEEVSSVINKSFHINIDLSENEARDLIDLSKVLQRRAGALFGALIGRALQKIDKYQKKSEYIIAIDGSVFSKNKIVQDAFWESMQAFGWDKNRVKVVIPENASALGGVTAAAGFNKTSNQNPKIKIARTMIRERTAEGVYFEEKKTVTLIEGTQDDFVAMATSFRILGSYSKQRNRARRAIKEKWAPGLTDSNRLYKELSQQIAGKRTDAEKGSRIYFNKDAEALIWSIFAQAWEYYVKTGKIPEIQYTVERSSGKEKIKIVPPVNLAMISINTGLDSVINKLGVTAEADVSDWRRLLQGQLLQAVDGDLFLNNLRKLCTLNPAVEDAALKEYLRTNLLTDDEYRVNAEFFKKDRIEALKTHLFGDGIMPEETANSKIEKAFLDAVKVEQFLNSTFPGDDNQKFRLALLDAFNGIAVLNPIFTVFKTYHDNRPKAVAPVPELVPTYVEKATLKAPVLATTAGPSAAAGPASTGPAKAEEPQVAATTAVAKPAFWEKKYKDIFTRARDLRQMQIDKFATDSPVLRAFIEGQISLNKAAGQLKFGDKKETKPIAVKPGAAPAGEEAKKELKMTRAILTALKFSFEYFPDGYLFNDKLENFLIQYLAGNLAREAAITKIGEGQIPAYAGQNIDKDHPEKGKDYSKAIGLMDRMDAYSANLLAVGEQEQPDVVEKGRMKANVTFPNGHSLPYRDVKLFVNQISKELAEGETLPGSDDIIVYKDFEKMDKTVEQELRLAYPDNHEMGAIRPVAGHLVIKAADKGKMENFLSDLKNDINSNFAMKVVESINIVNSSTRESHVTFQLKNRLKTARASNIKYFLKGPSEWRRDITEQIQPQLNRAEGDGLFSLTMDGDLRGQDSKQLWLEVQVWANKQAKVRSSALPAMVTTIPRDRLVALNLTSDNTIRMRPLNDRRRTVTVDIKANPHHIGMTFISDGPRGNKHLDFSEGGTGFVFNEIMAIQHGIQTSFYVLKRTSMHSHLYDMYPIKKDDLLNALGKNFPQEIVDKNGNITSGLVIQKNGRLVYERLNGQIISINLKKIADYLRDNRAMSNNAMTTLDPGDILHWGKFDLSSPAPEGRVILSINKQQRPDFFVDHNNPHAMIKLMGYQEHRTQETGYTVVFSGLGNMPVEIYLAPNEAVAQRMIENPRNMQAAEELLFGRGRNYPRRNEMVKDLFSRIQDNAQQRVTPAMETKAERVIRETVNSFLGENKKQIQLARVIIDRHMSDEVDGILQPGPQAHPKIITLILGRAWRIPTTKQKVLEQRLVTAFQENGITIPELPDYIIHAIITGLIQGDSPSSNRIRNPFDSGGNPKNNAMSGNRLGVAQQPWLHGGIDLNTTNGMQWKISKDGNGVEMNVNPAMIAQFRRDGISSLSPFIFRITTITNIWPLVGLQAPAQG